MASTSLHAITIRPAYVSDETALADLAALDSARRVPPAPVLVGEVEGRILVALSLTDGSAVADPFLASRDVLELMRAHAARMARRNRSSHHLLPRFA